MKRVFWAALALISTVVAGLGAAGNMTFSTLHPTNSASGTFESTSWLAYKQTEALARMADALAGSGLVITGTVVTLTNVSAMIAGQTSALDFRQTNSIPAGTAHIGTVALPASATALVETQGSFTLVLSGDTNVVVQLVNTNLLLRTIILVPYSNYVANSGNIWVGTATNGPFMLLNTTTGPWSKTAQAGMVFQATNIYLRSEVTNHAVNVFYAQ